MAEEEARFRQSQLDEALAHGRAKEAARAKRLQDEEAAKRAAEERETALLKAALEV